MRATLRVRPRDLPAWPCPALGALAVRAAVRARRHGDRRPHRDDAAGRAGASPRRCCSSAFAVFNFLTYGTTAQVARLHGAGRDAQAAQVGAQAQWLALGDRRGAAGRSPSSRAEPLVAADGRRGGGRRRRGHLPAHRRARRARLHARERGAGLPARHGRPAHAAASSSSPPTRSTSVLEVLFVYGFGWGLAGSAWGTVIAQAGMGAAFVRRAAARGLGGAGLRAHPPAHPDRRRDRRPHHGAARRRSSLALGGARARGRGVARRAPDRLPAVPVHRARARRGRDRRRRCWSGACSARATRRAARAAARRMIGWSVRRRRRLLRPAARRCRRAPARLHRRRRGGRARARRCGRCSSR